MFKNIIAYSFILIAGIILLAHDIAPHHHHEKDAIEQSQNIDSKTDKEHHHDFPKHKHQQDDYLFVFRQAFVSSANLGRFLNDDDECTGNSGLDYFFIHTPVFSFVYSPPDDKIPIWDETQNFTNTVTYSFGLRAPPAV